MTTVAHEQGSSLVEALVAALIMTTGVVTMAQLLSIATATDWRRDITIVAMILAEQKLEELRVAVGRPGAFAVLDPSAKHGQVRRLHQRLHQAVVDRACIVDS